MRYNFGKVRWKIKRKVNWINDGPLPGEIARERGRFCSPVDLRRQGEKIRPNGYDEFLKNTPSLHFFPVQVRA